MYPRLDKLMILTGVIGPLFYALVLLFAGLSYPDYSHMNQFMSELGAVGSPVKTFMNFFGFFLLGLFMSIFSIVLYGRLGINKTGVISSGLIGVSGLGLILVSVFPCDPGCVTLTRTGEIHGFLATITGFAGILALFLLAFQFRNDIYLRSLGPFLVITGFITSIFSFILFQHPPFVGLIQRFIMGLPLLWITIIGVKLYLEK